MTATLSSESKPTSRRALLAGAIGGLGALVASAVGRPNIVSAHDPDDVAIGVSQGNLNTTQIFNYTNTNEVIRGDTSFGTGIRGNSSSGIGVYGTSSTLYGVRGDSSSNAGVYGNSTTSNGVWGQSSSSVGVYGVSNSYYGVFGFSQATDQPAIVGRSNGNSTGVQGYGGTNALPLAKAKTGVYGSADSDSASKGVWGDSPKGHAVHGSSSSGFAGYFAGKVYTTRFFEMTEISAPAVPTANKARLFLKDNGSSKTQLCVKFANGTVTILATEG